MTEKLCNLKIYAPDEPRGDGIHLADTKFFVVSDSHVDFTNQLINEVDECIGITWGAEAYVVNCVFEGAQKIALMGCGDEPYIDTETNKVVVFDRCTFRHGCRRFPEVQDGMRVLLLNCKIEDWCNPSYYTMNPKKNRAFGAWVHKNGEILAINCTFTQPSFWKGFKLMFYDFLSHMGQTYKDEGILGWFKPKNWIPGVCRGLTSSTGGEVTAYNCKKNHWWIRIENNEQVSYDEATLELQSWIDSLSASNKLLYGYAKALKI